MNKIIWQKIWWFVFRKSKFAVKKMENEVHSLILLCTKRLFGREFSRVFCMKRLSWRFEAIELLPDTIIANTIKVQVGHYRIWRGQVGVTVWWLWAFRRYIGNANRWKKAFQSLVALANKFLVLKSLFRAL